MIIKRGQWRIPFTDEKAVEIVMKNGNRHLLAHVPYYELKKARKASPVLGFPALAAVYEYRDGRREVRLWPAADSEYEVQPLRF